MKLFEIPETEKTLDRLPELPEGVEVPEDISGLQPPTTLKPTAGGVRWMRWLAAIVLLAGAGVLTAVLLRGDDTVQAPVDYMQTYGTDNPAFIEGAPGPGTVEIVGDPHYMERYGTDNPVFVTEGTADSLNLDEYMSQYGDDYMEVFGTDNPTLVAGAAGPGTVEIVGAEPPTYMDLYGTDNPVFVPQGDADPVDTGEHMRRYGTDNPVFTPEPTFMELYGTDNPVFVER